MTITPAQIDALSDFTNAQMVKLFRSGIAELASKPQSDVKINGRSYTYRDMDQLSRMLSHFQRLAASDADNVSATANGCPVVSYQEEQV